MISRLLICASMAVVGVNGMFPAPPTPQSLREKMIESQHAKVCKKKKLRTKIKKLCKKWGYA
jgi:hypothetical protein